MACGSRRPPPVSPRRIDPRLGHCGAGRRLHWLNKRRGTRTRRILSVCCMRPCHLAPDLCSRFNMLRHLLQSVHVPPVQFIPLSVACLALWPCSAVVSMSVLRSSRVCAAETSSTDLSQTLPVKYRRVYSHLLLVVDDAEFHSADGILDPGQQRAIATTFNTLVFRTHCPAQSPEAQQLPRPTAAMITEWAPVLLRYPSNRCCTPVSRASTAS